MTKSDKEKVIKKLLEIEQLKLKLNKVRRKSYKLSQEIRDLLTK